MFNCRQNLYKPIYPLVEQSFGSELIPQMVIHKNVDFSKAAALQKAVVEYSFIVPGVFDFTKLTYELRQELEDE